MKKVRLRSLVTLALAAVFLISSMVFTSASTSTATTSKVTTKTFVGYLLDGHCAKTGKDDETGKINVLKNPEKHTLSCLKLEMCMAERLGVMVKQSTGKYVYYKFDSAGSKKADDNIMMMTKKKFAIKVAVTGTLSGTNLKVSSIKESK